MTGQKQKPLRSTVSAGAYSWKGSNRNAKKGNKKSTKNSINWSETFIGALADLIIGVIVALIRKRIE